MKKFSSAFFFWFPGRVARQWEAGLRVLKRRSEEGTDGCSVMQLGIEKGYAGMTDHYL